MVLTIRPSTANDGDTVTFRVSVSSRAGPVPTGTITISDVTKEAKVYGVASLKNGIATLRDSTLEPGSYNIVATYGGDGGAHYVGAHSDSVPLRVIEESRLKPNLAIGGKLDHQLAGAR